ncbi:MAG: outer membrane lipoprotein-sorting protein [bacterium]
MRIFITCFLALIISSSVQAVTGDETIRKMDSNMTFDTAYIESRMVIHVEDQIREKRFISYSKGRDTGYSEFISPARDKGVKYLKLKDNMWIYMPSVEKTIKIAGHMLRQSMMGSDISYEDAMESTKLLDKYTATLISEETVTIPYSTGTGTVNAKYNCFVVDLMSKVKEVTYWHRRIWVDKATYVPVKEELFAKSGKKLKVQTLGNVQKFDDRYYPVYYTMKDLLRANSLTEMFITKAEFNINMPSDIFTERNLTK